MQGIAAGFDQTWHNVLHVLDREVSGNELRHGQAVNQRPIAAEHVADRVHDRERERQAALESLPQTSSRRFLRGDRKTIGR